MSGQRYRHVFDNFVRIKYSQNTGCRFYNNKIKVGWGLSLRDFPITCRCVEYFKDNVGWGFYPNLHKNCDDLIGKKSINSSPCHPEIAAPLVADVKEAYKGGCSQSISGSYHLQEYTDFNINKSNVGVETPTYNNISLNTKERSIIWQRLRPHSPRKVAFTLAEVLITLGIIGVVAAMTLPSLIQKYQDKELANLVRKVYSDVNNAVLKAQSDFSLVGDNSGLFNPSNTHMQTAQNFIKYFNGAKICENSRQKDCSHYYYGIKYALMYTDNKQTATVWESAYPAIVLNNGAILYITQRHNADCYAIESYVPTDEHGRPILDENGNEQVRSNPVHLCGSIIMDVNGTKRPNRYGQDVYAIMIYKNKVGPSYQKNTGSESFKNILSGKDKFIYTDYDKGASMSQ